MMNRKFRSLEKILKDLKRYLCRVKCIKNESRRYKLPIYHLLNIGEVFILKVKSKLEWQILESFRAMQKFSSEISAYKVHVEEDLTVEAVASGDDTVIIIVRGCPLE